MRFRSLGSGDERLPTWAERADLKRLRAEGIEDVYRDVEEAPPEFWRSVSRATAWHLARLDDNETTAAWAREFFFATGLPDSRWSGGKTYQDLRGWNHRGRR